MLSVHITIEREGNIFISLANTKRVETLGQEQEQYRGLANIWLELDTKTSIE